MFAEEQEVCCSGTLHTCQAATARRPFLRYKNMCYRALLDRSVIGFLRGSSELDNFDLVTCVMNWCK